MCSKQQEINYYFISWIQVLVCMGGNRERNLRGGKKFEKEIQAANTNLPISITIKAMDRSRGYATMLDARLRVGSLLLASVRRAAAAAGARFVATRVVACRQLQCWACDGRQ